jgi:hypothetical protein
VFSVLATFRDAALDMAIPTPADIDLFRDIGENLSLDCYQLIYPPNCPNLCRLVDFIMIPSNQQKFGCQPNKRGGISTITIAFCTSAFTFDSFINLPFNFLHEYLSHAHTAELFAEEGCSESPPPFEDGWLLYAAKQVYCHWLWHDLPTSLSHPDHREYYVKKYLSQETTESGRKKWVQLGYRQAEIFEEMIGSDLFWKVTLPLAMCPFNHLPECADLHGEFMIRIKPWIRRMSDLPDEKRSEEIELIALAMEDAEPIHSLIVDILS